VSSHIAIGADHGGFGLKKVLIAHLEKSGHKLTDMGTDSEGSCDYPEFAHKVAKAVAKGEVDWGIVICKTGNGISMAANKVPGARAAICHNIKTALLSRQHNNANILAMGSLFISEEAAVEVTDKWLAEEFEGGRHERRVNQIDL